MLPLSHRRGRFAKAVVVGLASLLPVHSRDTALAQQYWNTNGTSALITDSNWGATPTGPFTAAYLSSEDMQFTANSTIGYVTTTDISSIILNAGVRVNWTAAGTLTTGGAVRTFNVGSGSLLDLGGQNFSTAAGTGFIKSGNGILFTSNGNTYTGGFTLDAGAVTVGGVNAMGSGGALTINGGTIGANAARDLTGKYTGIVVGGNFTLGGVTGFVTSGNAVSTANLTFSNAVNLGAATRTVTLAGTSAVYTFGGVISGATGTGLTVRSRTGGTLSLTGANTFDGATTINPGAILSLGSTGSILSTSALFINGGTLTVNKSGTQPEQIRDAAAVTFNGGGSYQQSNGSSGPFVETIGGVTVTTGQANFAYTNGASSGGVVTTLSSLSRTAATASVTFSNANPAQTSFRVSGAADTAANEVLSPWATFGTAIATQTDYAIYSGGNGTVAARSIAASTESTWSTTHATTSNYTLANASGSAANGRLTASRNINTLRSISTATAVTATNSTDLINLTGHGFLAGDVIAFGGTTAPTGLTNGVPYYVVNPTANSFQVALTSGGTAINFTADGASVNVTGGVTLPSGFSLGTYGILNGSAAGMTIGGDGGTISLPTAISDNLHLTAGNAGIQIDAPIANNGVGVLSLVKNGNAGVTLRGSNTFTGGITINAGTLTFNTISSWGGTGKNVTFGGAGTLASTVGGYAGNTLTVNTGAIATITPASLSFTSTTGAGTLIFATGVNTGLLNIGDAGTFTGDLQLRLNNNANYVGATAIQFSAIGDSAGSALQFVGGTSDSNQGVAITYTGNSALTFNNRQVQILDRLTGNWEIRDNILANNSANPAHTWTINTDLAYFGGRPNTGDQTGRTLGLGGSNTGNNTFAGAIGNGSGQLGITKIGAGTWILSGNNSYGGATTVTAGSLNVQHANALGATSSGTTVSNGAQLQLQGGISYASEPLTLTPGTSGTFLIRNISGNNTWNGAITANSATNTHVSRIQSDADTLTLAGAITLSGSAHQFVMQGPGNFSVTGQITGVGRVTASNAFAGVAILSNDANNFTGALGINGGAVAFTSIANVGSTASSLGAPVLADATIQLASATFAGTLRYVGTAPAGHTSDRVINLASTTGNAAIEANGVGPLTLTSAFTATGAGIKTLTLSGTNTGGNTIGGAVVDNSGTNTTAVNKTGVGTWVLSGNSTYTGATSITAGTLIVNGSLGNTAVTVGNGTPNSGILSGTGTIANIAAKLVTVASGGTISPGNSVGTLTTGSETWNGGGSYVWEISSTSGVAGTDWDLIQMGGGTLTVTATGASKFAIVDGGSVALSTAWHTIAEAGDVFFGATPLTPAGGGGAVVTAGFDPSAFELPVAWSIRAIDIGTDGAGGSGQGYAIQVSAVPEPGSIGVVALAGLGLLSRRRRRLLHAL